MTTMAIERGDMTDREVDVQIKRLDRSVALQFYCTSSIKFLKIWQSFSRLFTFAGQVQDKRLFDFLTMYTSTVRYTA